MHVADTASDPEYSAQRSDQRSAICAPSSGCRCCAKASRSASSHWRASASSRSPSDKSSWCKPSPTRRSSRSRMRGCSARRREAARIATDRDREVLQVINSSPGDLAPVFDAMARNSDAALRSGVRASLSYAVGANNCALLRFAGVPPVYWPSSRHRNPAPPTPVETSPLASLPANRSSTSSDVKDDNLDRRGDPHRRALVDLGGARTFLSVTLMRRPGATGGQSTSTAQEAASHSPTGRSRCCRISPPRR